MVFYTNLFTIHLFYGKNKEGIVYYYIYCLLLYIPGPELGSDVKLISKPEHEIKPRYQNLILISLRGLPAPDSGWIPAFST